MRGGGKQQLGCPEELSAMVWIRLVAASAHITCAGHHRCQPHSPAQLASGQAICISFPLPRTGAAGWAPQLLGMTVAEAEALLLSLPESHRLSRAPQPSHGQALPPLPRSADVCSLPSLAIGCMIHQPITPCVTPFGVVPAGQAEPLLPLACAQCLGEGRVTRQSCLSLTLLGGGQRNLGLEVVAVPQEGKTPP